MASHSSPTWYWSRARSPEGTTKHIHFLKEQGAAIPTIRTWKEIGKLVEALREIGKAHGAKPSQIAGAWAIAKGTLPIIGVTKVYQVEEAAKMADIHLTGDEISSLESLADKAGISTLREWEKEMA